MRAALKSLLNLDLDSITEGRAYFDNLSKYAAELLGIYEQAGRSQQERESLLKGDISFLVSFWGEEQGKVNEWEEDNKERDEPSYFNYYRAEWIEDLICQHLCNTGGIGCTLPDRTIKQILSGDDYRPALDLSNTSIVDYYPSLNSPIVAETDTAADIPNDLPTPNRTEREQRAFEQAIQNGWMIRSGEHYRWIGKAAFLGCFVDELYRNRTTPPTLDKWFDKKQVARYSHYYRTYVFGRWESLDQTIKAKYKPVLDIFRMAAPDRTTSSGHDPRSL